MNRCETALQSPLRFSFSALYLGGLANRAAPRCLPSWPSSPTAATNRAGAVRRAPVPFAHWPQSTVHGSADEPLVPSQISPTWSPDQSHPATLRRVFLKRGRRPAIVVACPCARVTSGAPATTSSSFFSARKKAREIHVRASRDSRTQRPVALAEAGGTVVLVGIGGPTGRSSVPLTSRAVGGGRSTRSACCSCDSGERQVRPKYQIPVDWWLLLVFLRFLIL